MNTPLSIDTNGKKIKLYSFYNDDFSKLKDRFTESIQDDYILILKKYPKERGALKIQDAKEIQLFKLRLLIDAIKENWSKIIIFSDIDIQFFGITETVILESMQNNDIAFQEQSGGIKNIGFMAIQCNEKTLSLWEQTCKEFERNKGWDQEIVNEILRDNANNIRWVYFPPQIWHTGSHNLPSKILLHHATFCSGEKEKLNQMNVVRKLNDQDLLGAMNYHTWRWIYSERSILKWFLFSENLKTKYVLYAQIARVYHNINRKLKIHDPRLFWIFLMHTFTLTGKVNNVLSTKPWKRK